MSKNIRNSRFTSLQKATISARLRLIQNRLDDDYSTLDLLPLAEEFHDIVKCFAVYNAAGLDANSQFSMALDRLDSNDVGGSK